MITMKVNKHGDFVKKRTHKFKCDSCGCKYTAGNSEWNFCNKYGDSKNYPTDYVSCRCPECNELNHIQWKGKFVDWWDRHWDWVLFYAGILMLVLFLLLVGTGYYGLSLISLILSVTQILLSVEHIN